MLKHLKFRVWISGRDGGIRALNLEIPSKWIVWAGDSRPKKFSAFWKFLLLWNETPRFRKIRQFSCNAGQFFSLCDNFLLQNCRLEVYVFQFYQELNAVRSKISELSRRISHILPVFGEIIVYIRKMIVDFKNINCGKRSYSSN